MLISFIKKLIFFILIFYLIGSIQHNLGTPLHIAVTDIIPSDTSTSNFTSFSLTIVLSYWNEKTSNVRIFFDEQTEPITVFFSNHTTPQLFDNFSPQLYSEQEYGFSPLIKPGKTIRNITMRTNQFNELPLGNYTFIATSGEVSKGFGALSLGKNNSPILFAANYEINTSGSYLTTQTLPEKWGKINYFSSPLISFIGSILIVILYPKIRKRN